MSKPHPPRAQYTYPQQHETLELDYEKSEEIAPYTVNKRDSESTPEPSDKKG